MPGTNDPTTRMDWSIVPLSSCEPCMRGGCGQHATLESDRRVNLRRADNQAFILWIGLGQSRQPAANPLMSHAGDGGRSILGAAPHSHMQGEAVGDSRELSRLARSRLDVNRIC